MSLSMLSYCFSDMEVHAVIEEHDKYGISDTIVALFVFLLFMKAFVLSSRFHFKENYWIERSVEVLEWEEPHAYAKS